MEQDAAAFSFYFYALRTLVRVVVRESVCADSDSKQQEAAQRHCAAFLNQYTTQIATAVQVCYTPSVGAVFSGMLWTVSQYDMSNMYENQTTPDTFQLKVSTEPFCRFYLQIRARNCVTSFFPGRKKKNHMPTGRLMPANRPLSLQRSLSCVTLRYFFPSCVGDAICHGAGTVEREITM